MFGFELFVCLFYSALVIANANGSRFSQGELYSEPVTDHQKRNVQAHYMGLVQENQDSLYQSAAAESSINPVYERFDFHEQKRFNSEICGQHYEIVIILIWCGLASCCSVLLSLWCSIEISCTIL